MFTEHLILAQSSSIDGENNSLSVFNFLEDLTIQSPGKQVNVPCQAVIVIKRGDERGPIQADFEIKVLDPKDKILITQVLPIKMGEDHRRARVRVNFHILVEQSGEYSVRVSSAENADLFKEMRFHVNLIRQLSKPTGPQQ